PPELHMEDVVLDGITAFRTTQWAGIIVRGGSRESRIRDVTIRNSVVHHVYGDGIVLFQVENGVIEKSAAWLTGLNPSVETGTPNGIWTWRCRNCVVRFTEGFFTDSPGVDGGVYDIDWGNENNIVENNYAHDAQGYCVSVFGAQQEVTVNSIVRYNVCVNNGRSPKLARRQGDFYVTTWEGGALDGLVVHNNTFYWTPPDDVPAVKVESAEFRGSRPNLFRNNVIVSAAPSLIEAAEPLRFEHNVYWHTGPGEPVWRYGGRDFRGIGAWRALAGASEMLADPRWDAMLRPQRGSPLLDGMLRLVTGALGPASGRPRTKLAPASHPRGRWSLQLASGTDRAVCRSQLVFLQAALAQYGPTLEAVLVWEDPGASAENLAYDWHLGAVRLERASKPRREATPLTLLVDPQGRVVQWWEGLVRPAELGLALRYRLGPPRGAGAPHPLWPRK
ncbi:MAG: right-handed parallel beta-helix repeat-containing protein, partial [Bryobacteraceae bacterium]|nr:right-handed parallel beta-helix repeat-containing protein [Bryobacteraceae bacterium]